MNLELTAEQCEILRSLVQRELEELGPEIHHTSSSTYRDDLKDRKELLLRLLNVLNAPQAVGQSRD